MDQTVAIIGPIDEDGKKVIREKLSDRFNVIDISTPEEYHKLENVDYAVLRTLRIDGDTIRNCPKLKLIQRWGVGYDTVDIDTAGECGVQVAITSGVNATSVAEYAVLLMLSVYRNLISINGNVRDGKWRDDTLIQKSFVIDGKNVGLVGLGNIGKQVARKVQGFGAEVCYYDLFRLSEEQEAELELKYRSIEELIKESDIISLHLPLTKETKNLFNKQAFSKMKSSAIIINTARGGIINDQDLYEALTTGEILGAGIDVFENEPVLADHPLLSLSNIVVSSHSAGNTADNSIYMATRCVENIIAVSEGRALSHADLVNGMLLKKVVKQEA